MGRNKALIPIEGRPLVSRIVEAALPLTDSVWIAANDAEPYRFLGLPVVADAYPDRGPLAGLEAALRAAGRDLMLALACDLPAIRTELLEGLVAAVADWDAVIPRTEDGRTHPLTAVYRQTCLPRIRAHLEANLNKVTDIFKDNGLRVRWLSPAEGGFAAADLTNLNEPADLERIARNIW